MKKLSPLKSIRSVCQDTRQWVASFFFDTSTKNIHARLSTRLIKEWATLFLLISSTTFALEIFSPIERLNYMIYDVFIRLQQEKPHPDITIVAIDDASLEALGRWPWSRSVHAKLIEKLTEYKPKAVAIDLIFQEEESLASDVSLANALKKLPYVFLPFTPHSHLGGMQMVTGKKPLPIFAEAVTGLGHIGISLDSDSIVRSMWLTEGDQYERKNHMMWEMYQSQHKSAKLPKPTRDIHMETMGWKRSGRFLIPYRGPPYHYPMVSYHQLLSGQVDKEEIQGKYILIGATTQSLNDSFSTPTSGNSIPMPGVEIHANILNAFLTQTSYSMATVSMRILLPLSLFCILFYHLIISPPGFNLSLAVALALSALCISYVLISRFHIWWSPATTAIGVIIAYPIWNWRRLETTLDYMGQEAKLLKDEPNILPDTIIVSGNRSRIDIVGEHIESLNLAIEKVRGLRRFIHYSLNSLPDAAIVTDTEGYILVTNELARNFFEQFHYDVIHGAPLNVLLSELFDSKKLTFSDNTDHEIASAFIQSIGKASGSSSHVNGSPETIEAIDENERHWLLKTSPCRDDAELIIGWIVSLIDLTEMRQAQAQRDEMLRFLSHDMRAPQSSILALLEIKRMKPNAKSDQEIFRDIEMYATRTLELADSFTQLARAESSQYALKEVNCQDLIENAISQVWALAHRKNIHIQSDCTEDHAYILADPDLLCRTFVNIIHNAIKYSPEHTTITCRSRTTQKSPTDDQYWVKIDIIDQGYGFDQQELDHLFSRYERSHKSIKQRIEGVGLGLAFVKLVIDRHNGKIWVTSKENEGSTFHILLPLLE